ncbi:MAG: cytochrome C oxidase subunit IV family protein [Ginsengibacter sp.]
MSEQIVTLQIDEEENKAHVKKIWKAFWILAVLTVIELALGLTIYFLEMGVVSYWVILFIKGVITILTFAKAFYIIAIFMHLGDEVRTMMLTIAVPATLFIWFITAFLWDGNSYKNLRNTNAGSRTYIQQNNKHAAPPATPPTKKIEGLD